MFLHLSLSHSVHGGVCIQGGWADPPSPHWILWDMVNERVVSILLECILVEQFLGKCG